jgi:hypothetical protein
MTTQLSGSEIEFTTVTLDETGQIIDRRTRRGQKYIEDLGQGVKLEHHAPGVNVKAIA